MYAFSPVAISSNELPSRGCATPLAARSRVMPDSCVNASEPLASATGELVFARRGNLRLPSAR